MAFDQETRNRLSKFVTDTRKLLSDEFAQQLRVKYGLDPATGVVTDIDKLPTMGEGDRHTAQMLRDTLDHYLASSTKRDKKLIATTIDRIVREQAFTVLNRLCAVRMAEARDLVIESIAQGTKSKGFQLYARLAGSALGETGEAYVCYLFSLFDELSIDLPVLFDRFSPSGRLFPKESVLLEVLEQINNHELRHLWAEDETIGWVYQYFNSQEERKAMRDESPAPRNSRELAVRNQFFTPRYIVEFLTDNTLGRIWYEMAQGQTRLVNECKYLVRRPDEVFLSHMTCNDREHPSQGTIAMAELLLSGTEETFREFNAHDYQPMIELAHCVSANATIGDRVQEILGNRTPVVRERSIQEPHEFVDAVEAAPYLFAGQLESLKTQHILEILFMTCRNDRHGGDGSVYLEPWFVSACNEVRRRVLNSRRDNLSQEELLRQPVFIPFRPIKDPRDIKMLDPACGSMHFGLYAFDLFLHIYKEAWELEERLGDRAFVRPRQMKSLQDSYGTRERYMLDVPRLIIEQNIHGIDIDSRAVQIAGLSLWLRAQKAWHEAGVRPIARPQVTRSNVVCAEPMPGESDLLAQFVTDHLSQTSEQQAIASIVQRVFDAMKLAGEAGSLLKIEEEIADTITEAKKKWVEGPKALQLPLFAIDAKQKDTRERPLLVAGIDDASFWDEIEERIYAALESYGKTAGGSQRCQMFIDDTARGFAFIEAIRGSYDAVLMNPPFGAESSGSKTYIFKSYPSTKNDLFSCFTQRWVSKLTPRGRLGAITSRSGFFFSSFQAWREEVLLGESKAVLLADLGYNVLDHAMVETAAYVIESQNQNDQLISIQLLEEVDKQVRLQVATEAVFRSMTDKLIHAQNVTQFERIPGSPFAYWVNELVLSLYAKLPAFSDGNRKASGGIGTTDDFRFIRAWWEIAPTTFSTSRSEAERQIAFVPIALGGSTSRFYSPTTATVKFGQCGHELKTFIAKKFGSASRNVRGQEFYFQPGLTWPLRGELFSSWPVPAGCVFSVAGKIATTQNTSELPYLLGFFNSSTFNFLIGLSAGKIGRIRIQHQSGLIDRIPYKDPKDCASLVGELATQAWSIKCSQDATDLRSHAFTVPTLCASRTNSLREAAVQWSIRVIEDNATLTRIQKRIDDLILKIYGLEECDVTVLDTKVYDEEIHGFLSEDPEPAENDNELDVDEFTSEQQSTFELLPATCELMDYLVGCVFGRWDHRIAAGENSSKLSVGPFSPLQTYSPAMQHVDGESQRSTSLLTWGIAVDDDDHPDNLERQVRAMLGSIWRDRADQIEHEICDQLSIETLGEWFRRPTCFFSDHLKRYSKHRRQAPIYWAVSTKSGNYTLWLYYQNLTDQTLFTAVNNFVEPKLKRLSQEIGLLRVKQSRTRDDEVELERLSALAEELADFQKELLRIARFWKPNLVDGVQVCAAPLWQFFQQKKWRETLKQTWEELEEGKYDWAHLALSIWPERVLRTAHKDRSIAISHGLEETLWHEVEIKKLSKTGRVTVKMEWHPRELSENELDSIMQRVKGGELGVSSRESAAS
jgi:hypothetical protein